MAMGWGQSKPTTCDYAGGGGSQRTGHVAPARGPGLNRHKSISGAIARSFCESLSAPPYIFSLPPRLPVSPYPSFYATVEVENTTAPTRLQSGAEAAGSGRVFFSCLLPSLFFGIVGGARLRQIRSANSIATRSADGPAPES